MKGETRYLGSWASKTILAGTQDKTAFTEHCQCSKCTVLNTSHLVTHLILTRTPHEVGALSSPFYQWDNRLRKSTQLSQVTAGKQQSLEGSTCPSNFPAGIQQHVGLKVIWKAKGTVLILSQRVVCCLEIPEDRNCWFLAQSLGGQEFYITYKIKGICSEAKMNVKSF